MTTRSVEAVARRILAQAGGPALEISASGLIDAAMVFRSVMPRTYTVSDATGRTPGATSLSAVVHRGPDGRENCPGVAKQPLRLGRDPSEQRVTEVSFRNRLATVGPQ